MDEECISVKIGYISWTQIDNIVTLTFWPHSGLSTAFIL